MQTAIQNVKFLFIFRLYNYQSNFIIYNVIPTSTYYKTVTGYIFFIQALLSVVDEILKKNVLYLISKIVTYYFIKLHIIN